MIRTERRLRLSRWLIALILSFIWGNSLLPAEYSRALSMWVKSLLEPLFPGSSGGSPEQGHGLLRKMAHFLEFAALGAALSWRFAMEKRKKIMPLGCGIGAACVDETIQLYVPGRGAGLKDVAIDTCGVMTGILLLLSGHYLIEKLKQIKGERTP